MRYLLICALATISWWSLPLQAQIVYVGLSSMSNSQQQALNRAKTNIENMLKFNAPVFIKVAQKSGLSCSGGSAVLAQAVPTNIYNNSAGLKADTWYPASLAVQLSSAVKTAQGTSASISAEFNPLNQAGCSLSWYYGTGAPGPYQVSFYDTAIHEIMHGLGFISFWDESAQWFSAGGKSYNDIFSKHLGAGSTNASTAWSSQFSVTNGQAAMTSNNVFWQGATGQQFASLLNGKPNKPKVYAPSPYESGSSISHFDTGLRYIRGEDEMMEPYASDQVLAHLSAAIFCDIGWGLKTDYDGDGIDDCTDSTPLAADEGEPPLCNPEFESCEGEPEPCDSASQNCEALAPGADEDEDGVSNGVDNCPRIFNPRQLDFNSDGLGDVCSSTADTGLLWGQVNKQQFGTVLAFAGDMNQDGYGDYWAASPKQSVMTERGTIKSAGLVQLVSGKTNRVFSDILLYGPSNNAQFGSAIVGNIDYDGDGCIDTFISAPNQTVTVTENGKARKLKAAGAVYRFSPYLAQDGACVWRPQSQWSLEQVFAGSHPNSKAGAALLAAAVHETQQSQLLIGEPGRNNILGQKKSGAVHLLTNVGIETQTLVFEGLAAGQLVGSAMALGRFDGTGQPLIAVSAPGARQGAQRGGLFWVGFDGVLSAQKTQPTYLPANIKQCPMTGPMVSMVNGSGVDVLAVGTPSCKLDFAKQGAVWLMAGNAMTPYTFSQAKLGFGNSLAAVDFDGDTESELLIGAEQAFANGAQQRLPVNAGSVFIWDALEKSSMRFVNGSVKAQQMGCEFASGGVDDDLKMDLILTHCGASAVKQPKLGATEIVLGKLLNY